MKYIFLIILFYLLIFGCSNPQAESGKEVKETLTTIDLTELPTNENLVPLSQFASEITYFPLGTNEDCLVGPSARFYVYDSLIVCCAHHQILTFNAANGEFIRSVGEYDRGPEGFVNSLSSYKKKGNIIITAIGWQYPYIELSANGNILNKFDPPNYSSDLAWLSDNLYVIYYKKNSNSDSLRIQIYDSNENKIVSTFYDYRKFDDTSKYTMFSAIFYYYGNKLFIKEYFNDTVFHVTPEKLVPTIIFNSGKYSPPFYDKDKIIPADYYNIRNIIETNKLIFFQLLFNKKSYYSFFDKRTEQVMVPNNKNFKVNGFENDIDGFMPFQPTSVSSKNKLVGVLEAYQIKKWFNENPGKAAKLPSHLQKFKNIDENDNPVLMLVKLKE